MRINQAKRIYMNEEDGSPGGGAVPPAPAQPAAAQPAPAIDVDSLLARLVGVIDEKLTASQNATFASLRKAGVLGKDKSNPEPTANPTPATPAAAAPASTGLSADDVKAIVARERIVTLAAAENRLTTAQVARMTNALDAEKPEDPASWAKSYLADMGLVRQSESATQTTVTQTAQTQTVQPQSGNPISDKGSPAPGGVVAWERELAESPISMSPAAFAMMVAKYGEREAWRKRIEAAQPQLSRLKVTR